MWPNPQFAANLVTFTEEILIGKLFLCSVWSWIFNLLRKRWTMMLLFIFAEIVFSWYNTNELPDQNNVFHHLLPRSYFGENVNFIPCQEFRILGIGVQFVHLRSSSSKIKKAPLVYSQNYRFSRYWLRL